MRVVIPLVLLLGLPCWMGCASGRIGSVHLADRGVLVSDADLPVVAVVTQRGVTRVSAAAIVPMNPSGRWAVTLTRSSGPRWLTWTDDAPLGKGMVALMTNTSFIGIDLDSGKTFTIPHGFDSGGTEIRDACVDGDALLIEVRRKYSSTVSYYHETKLPEVDWRPISRKRWDEAHARARSMRKAAGQVSASVELGRWGRLARIEEGARRQVVLVREGQPDLVVLSNGL